MTQVDWDPDQYRRFQAERSAPFWDLVGLVETDGVERMVDLGCGDGMLTAGAVARVGASSAVGVDSSAAMLANAAEHRTDALSFVEGDIASWTSNGDHDLVLANASLQWVPNHEAVLTQWTRGLGPNGQIAVQVPANGDHPSHVVADDVAHTEPFLSEMDGEPPSNPTSVNVLQPERYAAVLHELGFERQHVRLQVYPHVLDTSAEVVEWVRGTNLTRFFRRLPDDLHEPFVDAYRAALLDRIGDIAPYLYTFKRILMWGRRSG